MQPLASRARAVQITFWLLIAVYAAAFLSDLAVLSFLNDQESGAVPDPVSAETLDSQQALMSALQLALLIACAVTFCFWFARAHRNLGEAGVEGLQYSPAWAVGGFFVPFLNLVRPYQVMNEVWCSSTALSRGSTAGWEELEQPATVGWWWGLFLLASFLENAATRLMLRAEQLDELTTSTSLAAAADLVNLPAAFLALTLVTRITALQDHAHYRAATERIAG